MLGNGGIGPQKLQSPCVLGVPDHGNGAINKERGVAPAEKLSPLHPSILVRLEHKKSLPVLRQVATMTTQATIVSPVDEDR
ncbi:MAG: hypothetical protein R2867_07435 [Caldilineaceae bacterium]